MIEIGIMFFLLIVAFICFWVSASLFRIALMAKDVNYLLRGNKNFYVSNGLVFKDGHYIARRRISSNVYKMMS